MKLKEALYQTPEMTEEKLLEIINKSLPLLRNIYLINRIKDLHKDVSIPEAILKEYDLIQDKNSYLTKSQREIVTGFVGLCMIRMTKGDGGESSSTN